MASSFPLCRRAQHPTTQLERLKDGSLFHVEHECCPERGWVSSHPPLRGAAQTRSRARTSFLGGVGIPSCKLFSAGGAKLGCFRQAEPSSSMSHSSLPDTALEPPFRFPNTIYLHCMYLSFTISLPRNGFATEAIIAIVPLFTAHPLAIAISQAPQFNHGKRDDEPHCTVPGSNVTYFPHPCQNRA